MNLIITCPRHMEPDAAREAADVFGKMGDEGFASKQTGISGIITGHTALDPTDSSIRVGKMVAEEPWSVRYMRRIIPVHSTVRTDIGAILDAASALAERIGPDQTYRVSVEKRNSDISGRDIIRRIAEGMPNTVSLENPEITLQVEILGGITCLSLIRPGDIFSLDLVRRNMSED